MASFDLIGGLVPETAARWRAAARRCLAQNLPPEQATWHEDGGATGLLGIPINEQGDITARHRVPRRFLHLATSVACHRDGHRWSLLYQLLWRLTHEEPYLLQVASDPLVQELIQMHRAVRRASHKMKAFVRFRAVPAEDGAEPEYVAWFEPAHRVVERTAPFFVNRFRSMRWAILTPDGCARWDGGTLSLAPGIAHHQAPATADGLEDLWQTYYAATFNPARLNRTMMRTEMPARYWRNLPEARLIASLAREAPHRVAAMLAQAHRSPVDLPAELDAIEAPTPPSLRDQTCWHPVHDPGWREARRRAEAVRGDTASVIERRGSAISIGVAGWTDPSLLAPGVFYPLEATSAEARLRYYASRLPLVEVDSTYYSLPSEHTSRRWVERTPPHFRFDVKAHALMTGHPTHLQSLPDWLRKDLPRPLRSAPTVYTRHFNRAAIDEVWRRYLSALAPLREAGKLGAVMLQFPRWFKPTRGSARWLTEARARLGDWPASVELRHRDWLSSRIAPRTFRLLSDLGFSYVAVDAPPGMESSLPARLRVTNPDLAMVRLHGRRQSTWEARNEVVTERYRYLYDQNELEAWRRLLERIEGDARRIHIMFNNNHANYAVANALEMQFLMANGR